MSAPLIAHVVHRFAMGGMENGLVNLINGMDQRIRHAIVCLDRSSDFEQRLQRSDVDVIALNKKPGKDIGYYRRLFSAIRHLRPSVVHTRNIGTIEAGVVARLSGVRHVVHGEHGFDMVDLHGRHSRYRQLRRFASPFVRRFVCVSRQIQSWLKDDIGLPGDKLEQIYNGVDTRKFHPGGRKSAREKLRAEGVTADFVIGTVGRLEQVKNQAELLRAFAQRRSADVDFRARAALALLGDGTTRADLESQARAHGCEGAVHFLGARDDVAELLPGLDVFALPSLNEGISNTLLEAMACGLPVIASRVGGNAELFVDGEHGALYASGNEAALAEALGLAFSDTELRRTQALASRQHVAEHFSLSRMIERYEALYAPYL
ncbi:MAG: TIGR03088 family PEP-CTERM/XrtA system glycosyltransferase [Pseudomonadota bacterium]